MINNEALASRLVDFTLLKENQELTRQELVNEFQKILGTEIKERIKFAKHQTIRNGMKKLQIGILGIILIDMLLDSLF